eukprot:TRINITY_DN7936_c0_g1_i1.p1 TRINITY_DN7936_c0_g1~~TRINITY_DN7936_c0_g1_i1.p1  ORF type:complete len:304 (-),score=53.61 TRINITY_DN7936_c0_g1_i1:106-1017(-)
MKRPAASKRPAKGGVKKPRKERGPPSDDPFKVRQELFEAKSLMPSEDYDGPGKWVLAAPGVGKFAKAKPVELVYFAIRALGQLQQLCLEVAGYPYRYTVVTAPYFKEHLKSKLAFGRLPCLRTPKGEEIVQSSAVLRYAAKISGLAGKTDSDGARCDMLYELLQSEAKLEENELASASKETYDAAGDLSAVSRRETLDLSSQQKTMIALKYWEKTIGQSKSGWLLGGIGDGGKDFLCYVDLALYWKLRPHAQLLETLGCDKLAQFVHKVGSLPGIQRLLTSGRLMPAIGEGYAYQEDDLVKKA